MPADSLVHGLLAQIAAEAEDKAAEVATTARPSPFFAQLQRAVNDAKAPVRGR